MNLRDIEYIVSSAKLGCFADAAAQCHISQPTVSSQIKQVEEYLGITIFERSRRGVTVTPAGREVVRIAERILEHHNELMALKSQGTAISESLVKLGVFPTLGPYLLPHILPKLHEQYPNMKLHLTEEKTPGLLDYLLQGDIDIMLIALPIKNNELRTQTVFSEEFYLATHPQHPLAKKSAVALDDLKGESLLLLDEGHCFRDQALDVCKMAGAGEHQELRATSLETLKHMVSINLGITLVPKIAINKADGARYIPFVNAPKRHIGMVWRKCAPHQDFFLKLCERIQECLQRQ